MEGFQGIYKSVEKICKIFGVNFVPDDDCSNRRRIRNIVCIQIFFHLFTIYFYPASFDGVQLPVYFGLLFTQIVSPLFIEFAINIEAFQKRFDEVDILASFKGLEDKFPSKVIEAEFKELKQASLNFRLKFLILIVIRIIEIIWAGTTFSLNMMMPELVLSASDFAFTFYVDWLTVLTKAFSRNISERKLTTKEIKHHFLEFHRLAKHLTERFSLSLLLNITFNFIISVMSFYWFFIRIVYGPMR